MKKGIAAPHNQTHAAPTQGQSSPRPILLLGTLLMALLMALTLPLSARADTLPADAFKDMIAHADDYGFSHYTDIDVKDGGAINVEGWLSDDWRGKVDFAADGTPVREERNQKDKGPDGISSDQLHAALGTAINEGMRRIEKVDVDNRNIIEIEGKDEAGQELEIRINADTGEVTGVKRD
ncbi:PepSY domain-containing protein [Alcanivorax sp. JB21]|uniref:PepSY domain-containing protein n=1 Tax=Alcanivorax limicola TaxID=2874102 RepID=UPI001CBC4EEF|nr:PepSY domain-containing protein [Alcanivorax limicola]MBZ2190058.1 PepSY domain-containing protein [Alcanivorax limicola]